MTLPYWKTLSYKHKEVLSTLGDGINTGMPPFDIKKTEAMYLRNLDSKDYPALSVRPPRSTYTSALSTTNLNAIGQRNNANLHVVDGNTWKYWVPASSAWTNITTSLTSTDVGDFGEFATGTDRYTIFMNSTQKLIWDGSSTCLVLGDANTPFTKIFTIHKGRIYAARDNDIKFCALNATTDWTTASDAGSIDITRAKGSISGLYEYNDKVIVFTEYSMHELFGTGPDNYELIDVEGDIGCISDRSLIRCGRRLYWLWYDGIYEYDGGSPQKISQPVDTYIKTINQTYKTKCVAGAIGDFLYFSIVYGSSATSNNLILKFDTRLRKWYVEEGNFIDFVTIADKLYGLDTAKQLWNMRDLSATAGYDSSIPIPWSFISKPFNDGTIAENKTVSELYIVASLTTSTTSFAVSYSTHATDNNSTSFTDLVSGTTAGTDIRNDKISLPLSALQDVAWYRLKVAGTGDVTLHYLQKNTRIRTR